MLLNSNAQTKPPVVEQVKKTTVAPEKAFARQLFQAFKTNDPQLWQSLFLTQEEHKEFVELLVTQKTAGITRAKADAMILQRQKEAAGLYLPAFKKFRQQADSAGITWLKASYKNFIFSPALPGTLPRKYINGDIWCVVGKTEFVIESVDAVETLAGFRLLSVQGIRLIEDSY